MREAEAYQREYILSGDEISLAMFHEAINSVGPTFNDFRFVAASDESRLDRTVAVSSLIEQHTVELLRNANERKRGETSTLVQVADAAQGRQFLEGLRFNLSWVRGEEEDRLRALHVAREDLNTHTLTGVLILMGLAVVPCFTLLVRSRPGRVGHGVT